MNACQDMVAVPKRNKIVLYTIFSWNKFEFTGIIYQSTSSCLPLTETGMSRWGYIIIWRVLEQEYHSDQG